MALDRSNSSNLKQLALKGLISVKHFAGIKLVSVLKVDLKVEINPFYGKLGTVQGRI